MSDLIKCERCGKRGGSDWVHTCSPNREWIVKENAGLISDLKQANKIIKQLHSDGLNSVHILAENKDQKKALEKANKAIQILVEALDDACDCIVYSSHDDNEAVGNKCRELVKQYKAKQ